MNAIDFLSSKVAVVLPSRSNPKVYLAIDTPELSSVSFELYNPFSFKRKVFKKVTRFLCIYANDIVKHMLPTVEGVVSPFLNYVAQEIGKDVISSVYIATAKDKLVLQLVHENEILGYLKYPLWKQGEKRLQNEREGIKILAKKGLSPSLYYEGIFEGVEFIILENLNGSIGKVQKGEYRKVLASFRKRKSHMLSEHPRVISLQNKTRVLQLEKLTKRMDWLMVQSRLKYNEVYEHGDFAPWNLIRTPDGLVPFDFEYFVKDGLEHFDELKYHFQMAHLLEGKSGKILLDTIKSRVNLDEFSILFELFLLKEMLIKKEEGKSHSLETTLLGYLDNEKT